MAPGTDNGSRALSAAVCGKHQLWISAKCLGPPAMGVLPGGDRYRRGWTGRSRVLDGRVLDYISRNRRRIVGEPCVHPRTHILLRAQDPRSVGSPPSRGLRAAASGSLRCSPERTRGLRTGDYRLTPLKRESLSPIEEPTLQPLTLDCQSALKFDPRSACLLAHRGNRAAGTAGAGL